MMILALRFNEVLEAVQAPERATRVAGAKALGSVGAADPQAAGVLLDRLADEYGTVRRAAARALGRVGASDPRTAARSATYGASSCSVHSAIGIAASAASKTGAQKAICTGELRKRAAPTSSRVDMGVPSLLWFTPSAPATQK